jgi:hypothetical protein
MAPTDVFGSTEKSSSPGPVRLRQIVTPYRIACTVALTAALLLVILGFQRTADHPPRTCGSGPIVNLIPCPGDTGLSQGIIGVSLQQGYTAAIQIDGTEIPQDQVRSGGANQLYFQPGAGTETGALSAGSHRATIIYWLTTSDREHGKTFTWSFTAQ